jgi:hypothetical protein
MAHDFSEFYQMCGSVMQSSIENMIILDKDRITPEMKSYIGMCINNLLCEDDDTFRQKYLELYDIDIAHEENYVFDVLPIRYNKYSYAFACVSNIDLIKRCLAISKLPLSFAINSCTRSGRQLFINFDLESCKLLHDEGFDNNNLLSVACTAGDYNSIKYILTYMTDINLGDLIMDQRFMFCNLTSIYIIDKIMEHPNDFFKYLLKKQQFSDLTGSYKIPIMCYYIIRYLSREEGLSYFNYFNRCLNNDSRWVNQKILWNQSLEFHFRPRGGHTKTPNNS